MPSPDISLITGKPTKSEASIIESFCVTALARKLGQLCVRCVSSDPSRPMPQRLVTGWPVRLRRRRALVLSHRFTVDARLRQLLGILLGDDDVAGCDRIVRTNRLSESAPSFHLAVDNCTPNSWDLRN